MSIHLTPPITYLITSGRTTVHTSPNDPDYYSILKLIEAAAASEVSLIQLREKNLSARVLYQLAVEAVSITRGSRTRLLINDRFDVALAACADGVQLTSRSINTGVVRTLCGQEFLLGVSTHSLNEARSARTDGADFVLFGPVFETASKRTFGQPQGVDKLKEVVSALDDFPVIAIGGVSEQNAFECLTTGVAGIAAISLFQDASKLHSVIVAIKSGYQHDGC